MSDELYLCAYAREFPAQALLRMRPELRARPVAVLQGEAPFQQVCSLNKLARSLGVESGMSRAEMDSFPSVTVLKRSPAEEQSTYAALLENAGCFSPRIQEQSNYDQSSDNTFCCVLDISGTEKLYGPPQTLAMRLQQCFTALAIASSIAISANFHTALCVARGAIASKSPILVPEGQERSALAALPLNVLEVSAEHAETFSHWGVATLGMLAMLPEKDLIGRLGQEGRRLRQLARGEHPHLFLPIEPVIRLEEYIELDTPVEVLDSLLFGIGLMIDQLITRVRERILSLAAITAELGMEGGGVHTRTVRPALPSTEKQLWLKLLHLDLIAHSPQAAVLSMKLKAETGVVNKIQLGLFSPQLPEPGRLDVTLARIRAIVGEDRCGSIELKDTHEPDAFRMKPFSVAKTASTEKTEPNLPAAVMRRLRPPEKLSVTMRNACPYIFYFRGTSYQAETTYGPWLGAGGWWTEGQWSLEEWDIVARPRDTSIEESARRVLLCCCMVRDVIGNRWTIEALYD